MWHASIIAGAIDSERAIYAAHQDFAAARLGRLGAAHCLGIKVIVKDSANVESAINKLMAKYVAFYNFDKGQLEDDVWLAFRGYFSEYLLPKSYDFWEKHRFMYGPAFRGHVDSIPGKNVDNAPVALPPVSHVYRCAGHGTGCPLREAPG